MGSAVSTTAEGCEREAHGVFMGPLAHWPQAINSHRAQSPSSRAQRALEPWPHPGSPYYSCTLCLPLRSFYLSDFSRKNEAWGGRRESMSMCACFCV